MLIILYCILLQADFSSIHVLEYNAHLSEAEFTPVSLAMQEYNPLRLEPKGMLKNYYGYLPYWTDTSYYQYFQLELLTHISYFSVGIDPVTGSLGSIPNVTRFYMIRDLGHDHGVRIHMTYTIFNNSNVTTFLNSASARSNAISNISTFMTNYGIDGANIDFEFVTSSVRDSFNLFMSGLASALWGHPTGRKELYMASPAVPEWYPGYDIASLSGYTDGLFIMAYDFHWSSSSVAGPISPCVPSSFWGEYCAAKSIGSYKAYGASPSKIVLGLPYYGYDWPTVSGDMGSATTGTGTAVTYYSAFQNANTYGRLWDTYSLTPWYRYYSTEWHQCWYDDSASLGIKFGMVNDSLIQGSGCWALGYDRTYDHIWNAIRNYFWVEPPARHWTVEVNIDSLNVRDGPGTNYNIMTTARLGNKFVAFDYVNNWYKVYFPAKNSPYYAWMSGGDGITNQFMKGTTQNTILRINYDLLNIREGPGTSYPIITHAADGQVFVTDSFSGDWARIFLPWINNQYQGWTYHPYTNIITNPEDYNTYDCSVYELTYPTTVTELDTFTVLFRIRNTGFGPFDTLIYLKGTGLSPFYNPATWSDTTRAKIYGFPGLPNQTFYINSIFRAPDIASTTIVSDTFSLQRKGTLFGPQVIVTVVVNPVGVCENSGTAAGRKIITRKIFLNELDLNLESLSHPVEITLYDVAGRKVQDYTVKSNAAKIARGLNPGVYFLVIKSGTASIKEKIVKIR